MTSSSQCVLHVFALCNDARVAYMQNALCVRKRNYHVAFENMVHNLVTWQLRAIHQQLEHKLQPGIHFATSRFAFAFFATPLCIHIVRHDVDFRGDYAMQSQASNAVLFFG